MIYNDDYNDKRYNSTEIEIERILEEAYPNPIENESNCIICPNCGEKLYDGDIYYPQLCLCECCLSDYKQRVELD